MDPRLDGAPTEDFNAFLHHLRTAQLRRLPPGAKTVLSGGCSGSWYFEWFETNYPTALERHIGVEAYSPMPGELPSNVQWIDSTLGDLSAVPDESVDLVFAGQVLEHMWAAEVSGFLLESHRVLRPGGLICLDSPNRDITLGTGWHQPEHTVEFTPDESQTLLELAGFSDVDMQGIWLGRNAATGDFISIDVHAGGSAAPWQHRVVRATEHPEDAFIWWATASKQSRSARRTVLTDHVDGIFRRARPLYFSRPHSNVGRLVDSGRIRADRGEAGFVLYGPYIAMPPGEASATFTVARDMAEPGGDGVLGRVDVTASSETIAMKELRASDVPPDGAPRRITLPFRLPATTFGIEIRLWTSGASSLDVDPGVVVAEGGSDAPPAFSDEMAARMQFLVADAQRLRDFHHRVTTSLPWRLSAPLRSMRRRLRQRG